MLGSIRKGETIMATKRMKNRVWRLIGMLITSVWLIGLVAEAGAETMKLKVSDALTRADGFPVGDVQKHNIVFIMRDGSMVLENGETGSLKAFVVNDVKPNGSLSFLGYLVLTFADDSTIVLSFQQGDFSFVPEGEFAGTQEATGELVSGSGRFSRIKGTMRMTGKILKSTQGEFAGNANNEFILTYTLPPK